MAKYNGSVELISGITPANGQDFPLVAAHAVQADDDGTRLDEVLGKVQYDTRKGKRRQLGKACLWYHNFYDYGQNDDEAAAVIAQNEIVVAGGTLYAGSFTEEDKKRQLGIIAKARALNPDLKIFTILRSLPGEETVIGVIFLEKVVIGMRRKPQNIPELSVSIRSGKYSSCLSMLHILAVRKVERENSSKPIFGQMTMV